jgi:hypothetical protein
VLQAARARAADTLEQARMMIEQKRDAGVVAMLENLLASQANTARGDEALVKLLAEAESLLVELRSAREGTRDPSPAP